MLPAFPSAAARAIVTTVWLLLAAGESRTFAAAPPGVTLQLDADHRRHEARIRDAAGEAIAQYIDWFGPAPFDQLTIHTVPFGRELPGERAGTAALHAHWLQPERSLLLEADVARAIARQWWGIGVAMPDQFLADGIVDYAQSRTVERIYDRRHQRIAYSTYEARYFGGLVPWAIRALRLERQTAGIGRAEYRRHSAVMVRDTAPALRTARTAKVAAAFVTLERYIGWPALQRALSLAGERYRGRTMSAEDFSRTVSDAADRDLSWFFEPLFDQPAHWDYAIGAVAIESRAGTDCGAGPCLRSTIVLQRLGDATFTGTAHPPAGVFESGRALEIELEFADGQKVAEHWDGRAESKTLMFDGPSPLARAAVDPRGVIALDLFRQNNARSLASPDLATTAPWSVRWTIWLQDLLLTHALLF